MGTKNTIILKGDPVRKEADASGTILPGHLIYASAATTVAVHNVAGGDARKMFAVENDVVGGAISTAYSSGDRVLYGSFRQGDEVYALLAAAATAVTAGNPLQSAGDGTLAKHTAKAWNVGVTTSILETQYSDPIIAYAREAVDNSAGAAVARIEVEIA